MGRTASPWGSAKGYRGGGELKALGEDVKEILEYVPAHFHVIQQVRPKLACAHCDQIVQAAAPSPPIARALAGPGLLAYVLVAKYCDHLPLYWQEGIYAREGVEFDRATLADWVGGASPLVAPLVEAIQRRVMGAANLHADDAPVPVLASGLGKTKTRRLWTYVRDDRPAGEATADRIGTLTFVIFAEYINSWFPVPKTSQPGNQGTE
jgi:transposase